MEYKEVVDKIKENFPDEIHDCNCYLDMAQAAKADNRTDVAHGLYLIAQDEYTHAKFLRECMIDMGISVPKEEDHKYMDLEERLQRVFL